MALAVLLAGGCASTQPAPVPEPVVVESPFDEAEAAALAGEAAAAERAGDLARAEDLWRRSALAWPGDRTAWDGLARVAARRGNGNEAEGARFAADRLTLLAGDERLAERQGGPALEAWAAERRAEGQDDARIQYAEALAGYYADRRAARGLYEAPEPVNLSLRETPSVFVTLGAAVGYVGVLLLGN
jgi:hypothetical protein